MKGSAGSVFSTVTESSKTQADRLLHVILDSLEDSKAEDIVSIDIEGKSALGDYMVIVSGRSNRHVTAICDHLIRDMKANGVKDIRVEGLNHGDWVLIDTGDIIIHVFRPEMREFYNIEKMWMVPDIEDETFH